MDIAVLSDIHGNYEALQTCVEYALKQGIHTFFFLGDYVAEFPYPQRTLEMLFAMQDKYDCYFIRGNKEDYWLDRKYNDSCIWKNGNHTVGAMEYTYENQTDRDLAFYQKLPIRMKVVFEGAEPLMLCHGSPVRNNQKMLPDNEETKQAIEACECKYILCGHTHKQMTIEHDGKVVWNPGAVGVALHGGGNTQFMILHQKGMEWEAEFLSLPYEKEQILRELQECGLEQRAPYWTQITRYLLRTGEKPHAHALRNAMILDETENGNSVWHNIPDKYWIQTLVEWITEKEISRGMSGARVYELDGQRILKVAFRENVEDAIWAAYEKEALFYENGKADFLPKVFVNVHTDQEIFLILEKCQPLEREQLNDECLQKVMETLVEIHTTQIPSFLEMKEQEPMYMTEEELKESMQGWKSVLAEHPGVFEEACLEEIGMHVNEWNKKYFNSNIHLCHGDFHFENLLQDSEGNTKVIDWQNCGTGHASGDISFLLSRLSADGYPVEKGKVIEMYCKSAAKRGITITPEEIGIQMHLANLNTSFRFWHEYLHNSTQMRVGGIFEEMLADANALGR